MEIEIKPLSAEHILQFKTDMQESFQKGAVEGFEDISEEILPESHIDRSLNTKGAVAYGAYAGDKLVGGAVVVIDEDTQHNHLDFLYVKTGIQSKGIGQKIWHAIEEYHPDTKVWETVTPYFDKRNIHFYINRLGFHAVEFYNKYHKDPNDNDDDLPENEYFDGMFRFEKEMK